jgi:hypothetical protein
MGSTDHFIPEISAFFILNHLVGVFYKEKKKIVTEKIILYFKSI